MDCRVATTEGPQSAPLDSKIKRRNITEVLWSLVIIGMKRTIVSEKRLQRGRCRLFHVSSAFYYAVSNR